MVERVLFSGSRMFAPGSEVPGLYRRHWIRWVTSWWFASRRKSTTNLSDKGCFQSMTGLACQNSWVILESKLLPWAEIDFSDFCLRIFKLDIFTVVAGWSLHFIADLRGFSPMCVLAFDPLMCHLGCKLWTVKQQWSPEEKLPENSYSV